MALLIVSYDVSDPERFADYNPGSIAEIMATIGKYGGQPVAMGPPDVVTGSMESVVVCISFPDADTAKAWLADEENNGSTFPSCLEVHLSPFYDNLSFTVK